MKFRTKIPPCSSSFSIDHHKKLMMIGSCFSDHIGQKLYNSGFNVSVNPFGVLYNPISIANTLDICMEQRCFSEQDLIEHNGLFNSLEHHGQFSSHSANQTLEHIHRVTQEQSAYLKTADYLCLTFGTAYLYRHIQKNKIVANCHKLPAKDFKHELLSVNEIVNVYKTLISKLVAFNPKLRIIATVSPVRHWKDGAHQNQISKSTLLLAIHELQQTYEILEYYPAYELLMDDLRDYRFYKEDMLHPNSMAVNYVYEHFQSTFYNDATQNLEREVLKLKQALNHRAINPQSLSHQNFIEATQQKIKNLLAEHSYINGEILTRI